MEFQTVLDAIRCWPVEDQLRLVQVIQDQLEIQEIDPDLTPELKQQLNRRIVAHKTNPESAIPWEVVLVEARARHKK